MLMNMARLSYKLPLDNAYTMERVAEGERRDGQCAGSLTNNMVGQSGLVLWRFMTT